MSEKTSIKEFFKDKNVFLTGGSGFIGKGLIEKLLRSCPAIGNIYLLLRPKKGKCLYERVDQIFASPLFDTLKKNHPGYIKKIFPINGDTAKTGLGLSEDDRQLLIEEVDIFYHIAASVRFDDFLKEAIFTNVRSARETAFLALEMKKIEIFMHVSTTFCNIEKRKVIEEILYPSPGNWKDAITIAERGDSQTLNVLSQKFLGDFPNTYTYTKLLAEHCINDLLVGKVPTVICRPSVVVSSIEGPFQGWVDNFNGPVGLLLAGGSGLLRTVYADPKVNTDYVAVDNVVKLMIVATWHKAVFGGKITLTIYHASKYGELPMKQKVLVELGKQLYCDVPFEKKIWFPGDKMTKCWYNYYLDVILFHVIPAVFLDLLLRLAGYPPRLLKIQRKIYIANMAISYFMLNDWQFVNNKSKQLFDAISQHEVAEFNFKISPIDEKCIYNYYMMSAEYARKYLLNEGKDITPETRIRTARMYYLDRSLKFIFFALAIWMIFFKINMVGLLMEAVCNYWESL